ncbi:NAD(P)H-dependent flavin oxidoreductase [Virgibacillus oceani]
MTKEKVQKMNKSMKLPVIMAPMFLVSNPKMTIEACKEGIVGTFPALNARTGDMLAEWMEEITTELEQAKKDNPDQKMAPWGINFITHRSNKRYQEDLKLMEKYQPPLIITSLGDPSPAVEIASEYGGIVFSDVINIKFAKKAIEKGADGLVLVASGAGGHGGELNPVAFVNEVREFFDGPIVLAGALSKGEDILAAEVMGADFAYMGSRFIPTHESVAENDYKNMMVDANIDDIIYTDAFSGINANYLIPSITRAGLDPNNLESKKEINFDKMNQTDAKAWKDIWGAGQGVGALTKIQSVKEVVDELEVAYQKAIDRVVAKK